MAFPGTALPQSTATLIGRDGFPVLATIASR